MTHDATRDLARHAASLRYDALPPPLVALVKQCVLDTLGVAMGASTLAPEARLVADYVDSLGGTPESTVLGFGRRAPAPWAAFVNGGWATCSITTMQAGFSGQEATLAAELAMRITVVSGTGGTQLLSEPLDAKRRPQSSIDGKYSIPFTTAVMMVKGNVALGDYTDEGLRDAAVLAMADRVSYRPDPAAALPIGGESPLARPTVEVRTRHGRTLSATPQGVPGDPGHPVAQERLEEKFRDCVAYSARPVPARNVERAIELVGNLENLADAAEIVRTLHPA